MTSFDPAWEVRVLRYRLTSPARQRSGLLALASAAIGPFVVSIAVRRSLDGRVYVSYSNPRSNGDGPRRAVVRPVDDGTRRRIEREVLRQMGFPESHDRPADPRDSDGADREVARNDRRPDAPIETSPVPIKEIRS